MKILNKSNEKISFVEEIDESLANALRRSALEIPILAIDEIEFHKNDSALYDEILALRLGLIPLETPKDMKMKEECSCKGKGCAKCSISLKLKIKGPCIVYAKDLKSKAKPVYADMPIVNLIEGQELEFVAKAKLGKGIEHIKFSPGLVYYKNVADVENIKQEEIGEKQVIEVDEKEFEEIKKGETDKIYDFLDEVVKCENDYIYIKPGKELIFFIESWGQIKAQEIMENALKALKSNLKAVK